MTYDYISTTVQPISLQVARPEDSSPPWQGIDEDALLDHCSIERTNPLSYLLLSVHLPAAIQWAEGVTHRTIASRSHVWTLKRFPYGMGRIRLPRGKTQSVQSIVYSVNGVATTLTGPSSSPIGTQYQEYLDSDDGGVLMPLRGGGWPSTDTDVPSPVRINFTAGYLASQVPLDIISAIFYEVSSRMETRSTADLRTGSFAAGNTEQFRESLLSQYILDRSY